MSLADTTAAQGSFSNVFYVLKITNNSGGVLTFDALNILINGNVTGVAGNIVPYLSSTPDTSDPGIVGLGIQQISSTPDTQTIDILNLGGGPYTLNNSYIKYIVVTIDVDAAAVIGNTLQITSPPTVTFVGSPTQDDTQTAGPILTITA